MLTYLNRRLRLEEGVSLMEMLVAIFIIAIALSALASATVTSLTAISRDERRVRATHLANQLVEDLRAIPWDELTFYADDGAPSTFALDGVTYESIISADDRPSPPDTTAAPEPGPVNVAVDGITYSVTTNLYWIDDPGDGLAPDDEDPYDIKAMHVLVQWSVRGQAFQFAHEGTRAPTVDEVPNVEVEPSADFIQYYDVSPQQIRISGTPGWTESEISVTVHTLDLANAVTLRAVPHQGGTTQGPWSLTDDGTQMVWQMDPPLPQSTGVFEPGDYDFIVRAVEASTGLTHEATKVVTFAEEDLVVAYEVLAPTMEHASPGPPAPPLCKNTGGSNNNRLRYDLIVTFEVTGVDTGEGDSSARLRWTSQNGQVDAVFQGPNADDTGVIYQAIIPQGAMFTGSTTTITASAARTTDGVIAEHAQAYAVDGSC